MEFQAALPADLTGADLAKLQTMVEDLRNNHGGNGFAGIWCQEQRLSFLAVVADGVITGWILTPASSERTAKILAAAGTAMVAQATQEIARDSLAATTSTIEKARAH